MFSSHALATRTSVPHVAAALMASTPVSSTMDNPNSRLECSLSLLLSKLRLSPPFAPWQTADKHDLLVLLSCHRHRRSTACTPPWRSSLSASKSTANNTMWFAVVPCTAVACRASTRPRESVGGITDASSALWM